MSESATHLVLVQAIVRWIETQTDISSEMAILVSSPDTLATCQPPRIDGKIPDVFARSDALGQAIIGEAKTVGDIETQHSRQQFTAYLQYLAMYDHPLLIAAVPWHCVNQTRSLLKAIQRKSGTQRVKVAVLEQLPG